ncbi:hypothetical protein HNQ88_004143 [Aureibacter tunicatorum]|uniref:Uncharacterized protein n=1 Tax=Aureibacter tunicatorum TaxID=866807 RepID=A0AAE3XQ44_9BACT|nr:hypothetical protein [Aureibacter tunicatorum]BDD03845.1 hypothetical protein AUTU_13280 [Aureibacter tunicatorum]
MESAALKNKKTNNTKLLKLKSCGMLYLIVIRSECTPFSLTTFSK